MNDYGHVDDETPSLSISLYKEYRNRGIGSKLMKEIIKELESNGYKKFLFLFRKKITPQRCIRNLVSKL